MSKGFLSSADRAYFRTMMRRQINSAVHRRMNTLLLLDAGWSVAQVAAALFLDEGTGYGRIRVSTRRRGARGLSALNTPAANHF